MRLYNRESPLGNLLTDYMREGVDADIALMNSGAIRRDLNAGVVTMEDLINVYPFTGKLTVVELTGKQVRELIEYSLTLPYGIGQISGARLKYDSSAPVMNRLVSIQIGGQVLQEERRYTVCTSAFVANGGDGYSIFTEGRVVSDEKLLIDVLYNGFTAAGRIEVPELGRQVDVAHEGM